MFFTLHTFSVAPFSVQWSSRADFSNIVGEREVNEWNSFQSTMGANCRITDLTQGRRYFFRACCGNIKGWGQYRVSIPSSVTPSSEYNKLVFSASPRGAIRFDAINIHKFVQ